MFKWAVSEQLVGPEVWQALTSVDGLKKGRSNAVESEPIRPIDDAIVEKTCEQLSPKVSAMVRLQRLLGCRPHEICELRIEDFDFSGDVWVVRPGSHKTEHHGRHRVIMVGPKAQAILRAFLKGASKGYVFHSRPGRCYTHNSYRKAIQRGCARAGVEEWAPNRLRHNKATELRADFGIDTASAVLGHAGLKVTEVYAEKDFQAAMKAAREKG